MTSKNKTIWVFGVTSCILNLFAFSLGLNHNGTNQADDTMISSNLD